MNKDKMDVLDKYFLIRQVENIILELDGKKRGYLTNDKIEIQIGMWLKLLHLLKDYDEFDKNHKFVFDVESVGEISDGSHTFNELYAHRASLFAVICNTYPENRVALCAYSSLNVCEPSDISPTFSTSKTNL